MGVVAVVSYICMTVAGVTGGLDVGLAADP
jgi:hypothetical protein